MKIAVFGLGYVGCVTGACFAKVGHEVIGVDINAEKVAIVNNGECPIVEPGLPELMSEVAGKSSGPGSFSATTEIAHALPGAEVVLVCVGTPSDTNGAVNLDAVGATVRSILETTSEGAEDRVIVIRSTVPPGTTRALIGEFSDFIANSVEGTVGFAMNPEFLREGSSIDDFMNPSVTVIGEQNSAAGDKLAELYDFLDAPLVRLELNAAEMIKYTNNAFHAMKVVFANEIGALCKTLDIDSHDVMDVVCMDDKLNISRRYLKPGFAFGGSCLPKDLRALNYISRHRDIDLPMLESMLPSNRLLIERTVGRITSLSKRKVGMLGLSFKRDTDDLRESPYLTVAEGLIGAGFDLKVFDKNVSLSRLIGSNKKYLETAMPHVERVFEDDIDAVVAHAEVLVVCNYEPEYEQTLNRLDDETVLIDLTRVPADVHRNNNYDGLAW